MFRDFWGRKNVLLAGKPPIRRIKSYSAQNGYVYQYYYQGHRPGARVTEHVFEFSADRKHWRELRILLPNDALVEWEAAHARELSPTERYALAKLALFAAFDGRAPADIVSPVRVAADLIASSAEQLGFVE